MLVSLQTPNHEIQTETNMFKCTQLDIMPNVNYALNPEHDP